MSKITRNKRRFGQRKVYSFLFRFIETPPFQYLRIDLPAATSEKATIGFHCVAEVSGILNDLENRTYSVMGHAAAIDDLVESPMDISVTQYGFML